MPDTLRLLHRNSQHGYTDDPSRALSTEPEAISEHAYHELEHKAAIQRAETQRIEWAKHRATITRELAWLQSQRFRRDVRSQTRALERQLQRIDSLIA